MQHSWLGAPKICFYKYDKTCSDASCCSLSVCVLQNHLLEVGWNNSQSTQRDVEKSLNCCGFKKVDLNGTCDAVSSGPLPRLKIDCWFLSVFII